MGFMDEKFEKEKEGAQKEQATEIKNAVNAAVVAAIAPLQNEIITLKKELINLKKETIDLKKAIESPSRMVVDDETKKEIKDMIESGAAGIDSYKYPVYVLFGMAILLAVSVILNFHKLKETAEYMDWKYDAVTGILSGDHHYWWNGENYEASWLAPEAKRLQEALDSYKKINAQMKKQLGNK